MSKIIDMHTVLGGPDCECCRDAHQRDQAEIIAELESIMRTGVANSRKQRSDAMHYRNGREAKNGDKVIQLSMSGPAKIVGFGILHDAVPGNDYCNGSLAPLQPGITGACMVDCLHADDVIEMLTKAGLNERPKGK